MTRFEAQVAEIVRGFADLPLDELRAEWRRRYGAPPALRSAALLRLLLAWRVQAEALGGLEARVLQQIRAAGRRQGRSAAALAAGTRLAREWQGRLHEVEVQADGVLYQGRRYRSLSAVARLITGARWNGPRFFGLRSAEADV